MVVLMERLSLALVEAPVLPMLSDRPRLELSALPGEPLQLEMLHDENVGTYARVYRGRLRLGNWEQPVAVKIQREHVKGEAPEEVAAKFNRERLAHLQLQADAPDDHPFVRLYDVGNNALTETDTLPPAIVCREAAGALAPYCPSCARKGKLVKLQAPDALSLEGADRKLTCEPCASSFSFPGSRDAVLKASVQHDPFCQRCPHRQGDNAHCLKSTKFLTFFPARILLQELLDLDLGDYFLWWRRAESPPGRAYSWERFEKHRARFQQARRESPWLIFRRALRLFDDLLRGLRSLHDGGISHWDLKPNNVCLRFEGDQLSAKIIDLGLSEVRGVETRFHQMDAQRELSHDYAPAEIQQAVGAAETAIVVYSRNEGWFRLDSRSVNLRNAEEILDPFAVVGDEVEIEDVNLGRFRLLSGSVSGLESDDEGVKIHFRYTLPNEALPVMGPVFGMPRSVTVRIFKSRGPAADFFSLGMLMVAVLSEDGNQRPFRNSLPALLNTLWEIPQATREGAGRELVQALCQSKNRNYIAHFIKLESNLALLKIPRFLTEELLGIVLRLLLRDERSKCYLTSRSEDVEAAHDRLRQDLDRLRNDFETHVALQDAKRLLEKREKVTDLLRDSMKQIDRQAKRKGSLVPIDAESLEESLLRMIQPEQFEVETRRLLDQTNGDARSILLALGEGTLERPALPPVPPAVVASVSTEKSTASLDPNFVPAQDVQRMLGDVLVYVYHLGQNARQENNFLHTWNRLQQPKYREGRRWRRWCDRVQDYFQLYEGFQQSRRICSEWMNRLQSALFFFLEEGFKADPLRREVEVSLKRSDLEVLLQYAVPQAVVFLRETAEYLARAFERRRRHFTKVMAEWDEWSRPSSRTLQSLRARAEEEWQRIENGFEEWRRAIEEQADALDHFSTQIEQHLIAPWKEGLQAPPSMWRGLKRVVGIDGVEQLEETALAFQRGWLDQWQQITHPETGPVPVLKEFRLGPAYFVEVVFALQWFENLKSDRSARFAEIEEKLEGRPVAE